MNEQIKTTKVVVGDQWTPKTLMDACVHIRTLEAENERLRSALREIGKLTHGNSNWAPGMATRALGGHYEHAGL